MALSKIIVRNLPDFIRLIINNCAFIFNHCAPLASRSILREESEVGEVRTSTKQNRLFVEITILVTIEPVDVDENTSIILVDIGI